ncbi:peptidyl-glycine alpha-amidating monooxygenase isoform X2 [Oenanthe melanoleuca]|uniref:peptidyl-glycine alpha-amidating monooxygenase isoform X2 n=1 Tax=Oenanthe melanoleuca TaxID=2939378 RepID=UPI0024C0F8D1|nr:peptidyl-glycine alpha-amidating monooxygenase isoform X2 [Oenanthe melanoleuca]XP_056369529.1 peptidyl-glycine alpha-amidating monooxygenase isoform X2 [Oenanthe melanoleuca]XP_056369530.1 peptidyl-glycine alpha-amidating monooxygenase isoform X2 [Oenanthe melanoleuca]XP_056369531.1 peptidyl-glycine alpha-amidating monooxygenase isoform X2 [Oenanthe melanoleuca]XP_056369532.1 peptidyl-glycine alpha-amidating monooxygenase isoform X2 [Oenanthe melanoleuca]XP_056369533.1 peptidyl-glycine alp
MAGFISNLLILLLFQNICLGFRSPLSIFKSYKDTSRSHSTECLGSDQPVISLGLSDFALDIRMPAVTPKQSDTYLCMSVSLPVDDEAYVVDFKPHASMDTVHHMLLFGCNEPSSTENYWDCDEGTCKDKSNILYAWARNAPPTRLPKGVGFRVGGETGSRYFVLQVHYGDVSAFRDKHRDCSGVTLHLTHQKQPLIAGMYLMMSVNTVIPPGKKVVDADIACHYKRSPMHLFAYRVHTHRLGKVVSGYRVRNGQWTLIGRQSPQLPQAFYPVKYPVDISYDDILAARCVFSGEGRTTETHIGGTADDEMCNFYIMYYMEAKHAVSYMTCTQNVNPEMFRNIPQEANIPIPVKSDVLKVMHGHHEETKNSDTSSLLQQDKKEEDILDHETKDSDASYFLQQAKKGEAEILDQGDFYSLLSKLLGEREDVVNVHKHNPTEKAESDLVAEIANVVQKKDLAREITNHDERDNTILVRDRMWKFHRLESTLRPPENRHFSLQQSKLGEGSWEKEHKGDFHIAEAVEWPGLDLKLGQVSGLALDPENNLVVFHRGDHVWDENSFDSKFIYQQRGLGPIEQNTIIVLNPSNAKLLHSTGKSLFYLPHGLSVDKNGNYWVTDVALHQVFKLGANDKEPLLILGMAFQPGSDKNHFCQPTDVAVDPITGNVYVSDGYCNSRIIQFSPNGLYVMQWGEETSLGRSRPGQFRIPHSLALIPDLSQLCIADRENGRIQCFRLETAEFTREIKHKAFGRELFAVSYVPGGLLFAVNGMPYPGEAASVQGFVMNFSTGEIIDTFIPLRKSFEMPHDIIASEDRTVFVGDVHAKTVWKFASAEKSETIVEARLKNKPESTDSLKNMDKQHLVQQASTTGVSFVLITTLLIIPVVVLLAILVFIRWRKTTVYGGKDGGGINLGNFFAHHKGYSRKGFDRLSTEGSDQEKDEDDGTDSEEECSASSLPPAPSSS